MHWTAHLLLAGAAVALGLMLWIRLAPSDPATWHVDPLTAHDPASPNFARLDLVRAEPPAVIAALIASRAGAEDARRLAGDDSHATWIVRSNLMGYPDYISLRLIAQGSGTRVVAFSRSRFGYGDRGVNAARLGRWLAP